jgi:hypothetical protein
VEPGPGDHARPDGDPWQLVERSGRSVARCCRANGGVNLVRLRSDNLPACWSGRCVVERWPGR